MSEEVKETPTVLEIVAGGRTWKLGRVGFLVKLDAEEEIRKQRRAEFSVVLDMLKDSRAENTSSAILAAFDNLLRNVTVSSQEAGQWLGSPSGELHQIWKSLQAEDRGATIDDAKNLMSCINANQYAQLSDFMFSALLR